MGDCRHPGRVKIVHLEETDSTNRWLREEGGEEDVLVWTDYQSAGRGCGTNRWESERGKNLLFSLLIHPVVVRPSEQFRISMSISLAIVSALSDYTDGWSIKWPNDIYWHDRKICGILIENRLAGSHIRDCVIGIGLNVNQKEFKSEAPNPVSMLQLEGKEWDREEVLRGIIDLFVWQLEHFRRDKIREKYRRHLYRREGFHNYRDAKGDFEAELVTVEDDGHLVLRDKAGNLRSYAFKEVQFVI